MNAEVKMPNLIELETVEHRIGDLLARVSLLRLENRDLKDRLAEAESARDQHRDELERVRTDLDVTRKQAGDPERDRQIREKLTRLLQKLDELDET